MRSYLVTFVLVLGLIAVPASAQVARMNDVVSLKVGLKEMLQTHGAQSLKKLSLNVDSEHAETLRQKGISASGTYTVYQGIDGNGGLVGTVVIVNERGKEGPLQVLVALNPDGEVYDIGFTLFGEDKGKPAMNWTFLNQFINVTATDMQNHQVDA